MKHEVKTVAKRYGNMVEVITSQGEIRIILNDDGTFRLITDLKTKQIKDIKAENKDFYQYETVVQAESFGHPAD